jgi:hypothetical protein
MRHKRAAAPFLAFLTIAAPVFCADMSDKLIHKSSTQLAPFQAGGTIHVNHSFGELWVEGWDRPEVEVTSTKSPDELYGAKDKEAGRLADNVRVAVNRRSDGELEISTSVGHFSRWRHPFSEEGDVMMEYLIRAPRNAKLVIHHKDGTVLISNMLGDIEASGRTGDIVVLLPESGKYSIDAKSQVGTLSSDFEGKFHHVLLSSGFQLDAPAPTHRIHLRMGAGGIEIKGSPAVAVPPAGTAVQ